MSGRRPVHFSYAPEPADDELLSSWVHRMALGQESCGTAVVGDLDVDWDPPESLLIWLAEGGDQPVARLRSMTLSAKYPAATRRDFARSKGAAFPGCHAYCPICAEVDRTKHGEVISRAADAGFWRLRCRIHPCFLQSAGYEIELTPHRKYAERTWSHGRHTPLKAAIAPPIVSAFERAMDRASIGRDPGALWRERDPVKFRDAATVLANLCLVLRRTSATRQSATWALVGGRHPEIYGRGPNQYDPSFLRGADASVRTLAWTAAARLLLTSAAAKRIGDGDWWSVHGGRSAFPWLEASDAMTAKLWDALWVTAEAWGAQLRQDIRAVLRIRYRQYGLSPPLEETT